MTHKHAGGRPGQMRTNSAKAIPPTCDDSPRVIVPAQIHGMLSNFRASIARITGTDVEIGIDIAECVGPIPSDYVALLWEVLYQCVKFIGWRSHGSPSVEARLSEVPVRGQLSHIVMEVENRGEEDLGTRSLDEDFLRLRGRAEQWGGFLLMDSAENNKTLFCLTLPIISIRN